MSNYPGAPWTFEPMEIDDDPDPTWPVYDPNLARVIAVFYTEKEARAYLRWVNKKQARKKAAKQAAKRSWEGSL